MTIAQYTGGCICGAVRYRFVGEPTTVQVCHCRYCQRRLGTSFAELAYFSPSCLQSLIGQLAEYEHRSNESGRWLRSRFCVQCGTTVLIALEYSPRIGLHLGTLDDPEQLVPTRHIFTRSKRAWVQIPNGATTFPGMPPPPAPLH
jgi:hypothetical protein